MRVMTSAWSSVVSVTSQVMPSGSNTLLMPSSSCDAVGGAGNLDRHPDEIALLHQALVDQILRPAAAEDDVVAADIGVEVGGRVGRVEVDDRDVGGVRLLDDLDQAARIGAGGDDAVGLGGDRRAHRFLLRRHVAIVERGVDRVAGVLRPLLRRRRGSRSRPDRPGRHAKSSRRSCRPRSAADSGMAIASTAPATSSLNFLSIDFLPLKRTTTRPSARNGNVRIVPPRQCRPGCTSAPSFRSNGKPPSRW